MWTKLLSFGIEDYLINTLIYALLVTPFFLIFWVFCKKIFEPRRIQQKVRSHSTIIWKEILNSAITLLVFAVIDVLLYIAQTNGYTLLYTQVSDYGWSYFFASILLMVLLHDTWFYWTHRLMHHPWLYKYVHKVHHESIDPSPFAAFSFHPFEALIEGMVYVIFSFLFPVHIIALYVWQIVQMFFNVIGHLGYELYPQGFTTHWLFRWKTPSTHHNMHHAKFNGNYGLYFTWWDIWMKTEFKDYQQTYKQIHQRLSKRKVVMILIFLSCSTPLLAQNQIVGHWLSEDKEGTTEIYEENGKYYGKISWLKKPGDEKGIPFKDTENPESNLRAHPLLGLVILNNFQYKNGEWKDGTIYDPESGHTYQCAIWLTDNNTMKVRGYWGIFYQTQVWTRSK